MPLRRLAALLAAIPLACAAPPEPPRPAAPLRGPIALWEGATVGFGLALPDDARAAAVVRATLARYLQEFYGVSLPRPPASPTVPENVMNFPGVWLVAGTPQNNPTLAELVRGGLTLTSRDLGDEGFQLISYAAGADSPRYIVVHARTPRALKHGLQELVFYHMPADASAGRVEWPLDVTRTPAVAYRGVYILPCWSAHDSLENWQAVLRFHSDLTINRNWFWLGGFPVAGHTGDYAGTALASDANVQSLIDLTTAEEMKFLIGDGWMNWHHGKAVGADLAKGQEYYRQYLARFPGAHGLYFEPTGEGEETKRWKEEGEALADLMQAVLRDRPDLEIAIAIGKFNNADYLKRMATIDPARIWWWWCWGDPHRDQATELYPKVTRWHLSQRMSEYHGSMDPPGASDLDLAGVVTSYDPGQGYGNPWNGWGKLGFEQPRNFNPRFVPYFARQWHYRERCWDPALSEDAFVARLHRRLFDAGAPPEAGRRYWELSQMTEATVGRPPRNPDAAALEPIRRCLAALRALPPTPRMSDTLERMEEAVYQLGKLATAKQR